VVVGVMAPCGLKGGTAGRVFKNRRPLSNN